MTYSEHLDIGYRWYDADPGGHCATADGVNPCVAFPFGYGLSYTRFATATPKLVFDREAGRYRVSVTVKNVGQRAGAEVIQSYLSLTSSASTLGVAQSPKRPVGFGLVELAPGEAREVAITIDPAASNHPLSVWNVAQKRWVVPTGSFVVLIDTSAAPKISSRRVASIGRKRGG